MEITINIKRFGVRHATVTFTEISEALNYLATKTFVIANKDAAQVSKDLNENA